MGYTLKEQFELVFDDEKKIKLCGRYACMGLITQLTELRDALEGMDFGNPKTGMMNVENILKAKEKLNI